ncbi:MAG: hypothetical protein WCI90_07800 [Chlorobium sp.]|nr:MAG: hypothetical protein FDX17_00750 [Chlorobium sp.]
MSNKTGRTYMARAKEDLQGKKVGRKKTDIQNSPVKQFFISAYSLGALIPFVSITSGAYRKEMSLSVFNEYEHAFVRHGQNDALFMVGLYIFFYSIPFVYTFLVLFDPPLAQDLEKRKELILGKVMFGTLISAWELWTFLFLFPSCAEFIRNIDTDTWNGWLFLIWCFVSVFVVFIIISMIRDNKHKWEQDNGKN